MESLANNFSKYFLPRYAASRHQKRFCYSIRYKVYAEELGWEAINNSRLETDHCDNYAHHCLLEHKRTGDVAGCVRLVVPQPDRRDAYLPYRLHSIPEIADSNLNQSPSASVGEISRLAVPDHFRRRSNESGRPFILDQHNSNTIFTEEERRNFPNIAIGLYLSSIALAELCELELVLVVMEPRLQRLLKRYGLHFQKISDHFELQGERALFELPRNQLTSHMPDQILELYELIKETLAQQPWQAPQLSMRVHSNDRL
ncbi:MAG: PEP-CTERM/exosortase system-associated acyltransferase [Candidatus Thiodiazotropha sp. 6PLUC2]